MRNGRKRLGCLCGITVFALVLWGCAGGKSTQVSGSAEQEMGAVPMVGNALDEGIGNETERALPGESAKESGAAGELGERQSAQQAEAEYERLCGELARLADKPLTGAYGYEKWAGEMTAALDPLMELGSSLDKDVREALKDSGLALRVTPWEHCALPLLEAGREADGYRLVEVGLKKENCREEPAYCYYLEEKGTSAWRCSLPLAGGCDSFALKSAELKDGSGSLMYVLAAGEDSGEKTSLNLWRLEGEAEGQMLWGEVMNRRIPGRRDGSVQVEPSSQGFSVGGAAGKNGAGETFEMSLSLDGDRFTLKRTPGTGTAAVERESEYGLLLGMAGTSDLRTFWVTAENGRAAFEELPDVVLRWSGDGMREIRYLYYRETLARKGSGGTAKAGLVTDFDWKLLSSPGSFVDSEGVRAYVDENYTCLGALGETLDVQERLEFVGEDALGDTADTFYWGGGTGKWSDVHAFQSPVSILLQNDAWQPATELEGMKNSARNALDEGIEHYRQVFEVRGEQERTVGTVWQDVPLLNQVYFTRSEGSVRAALPVVTRTSFANGSSREERRYPLYLDADIPEGITGYDKLMRKFDRIRYYIPEAVDAVSAPGGNMLAVLTDREILVFVHPEDLEDLTSPDLRIPIYSGDQERIVTASWVKKEDREMAQAAMEQAPDHAAYMGKCGIFEANAGQSR